MQNILKKLFAENITLSALVLSDLWGNSRYKYAYQLARKPKI